MFGHQASCCLLPSYNVDNQAPIFYLVEKTFSKIGRWIRVSVPTILSEIVGDVSFRVRVQ